MQRIHTLPDELLVEIFRLATHNPVRDLTSLVTWTPFEGTYASLKLEECKAALRTKRSLTLACRRFRRLMPVLLYEDIWVRYGSGGLREVLESSKRSRDGGAECAERDDEGLGYGRFARRITLTLDEPAKALHNLTCQNARAILSCCPYVRVISRPPQDRLPDEVAFVYGNLPLDGLEFPHLQRVEWYNAGNESVRAIEPTPSVFLFSETLKVLVLGPDNFPSPRSSSYIETIPSQNQITDEDEMDMQLFHPDPDPDSDTNTNTNTPQTLISLPNLHSLSIQSLDTFGPPNQHQIHTHTLSFPSLKHLTLQRPEAIYTLISSSLTLLSNQITSLELSPSLLFLRHDFLSTLTRYLPTLSQIYLPIFYVQPPHLNTIPRAWLEFRNVNRVFLHAGIPCGYSYEQESWWRMVEGHVDGFVGLNSRFVELERVVLCGREWMESVCDARGRFEGVVRVFRECWERGGRGVELVAEEEDVQRALRRVLGGGDGD